MTKGNITLEKGDFSYGKIYRLKSSMKTGVHMSTYVSMQDLKDLRDLISEELGEEKNHRCDEYSFGCDVHKKYWCTRCYDKCPNCQPLTEGEGKHECEKCIGGWCHKTQQENKEETNA